MISMPDGVGGAAWAIQTIGSNQLITISDIIIIIIISHRAVDPDLINHRGRRAEGAEER